MYLKSSILCLLALSANVVNAKKFLREKEQEVLAAPKEVNPTARKLQETAPAEAVPPTMYEGAGVMCEHDPVEVFRWTDGELRHYIDPRAAASWDNPKWRQHIQLIDCEGMRYGPPIRSEGQAILCLGIEDRVFRFNNDGLLHHYVNPHVADNYDRNWRDDVMHLDCSNINFGNAIEE
uniref:Uncharacterized protein n=2 Tax=Chaetoceros debilis TaxID=122233 RepID=A0A7S3Q277_9STRA|mmetsp:Transcript_3408/g.4842  ORF Transcript_3408/g.4842 Transcript_3408/m.4842 type:complete len:178 (+) Transcript_3408:86-619(+)|eukprot:CAMPEP_0194083536 /NCGR_PEP_ID=MMETSP0149-20130528/9523_1 /TAXON_ID=122233 /ORGANISM="Chaetoceros debilis, Strain MM31A-1" /LENGTH=177 /DNA_ID=CAMNT_0038765967 /DNA_START=53 /DNA_END=589 /DNA_ORIENTATION=+